MNPIFGVLLMWRQVLVFFKSRDIARPLNLAVLAGVLFSFLKKYEHTSFSGLATFTSYKQTDFTSWTNYKLLKQNLERCKINDQLQPLQYHKVAFGIEIGSPFVFPICSKWVAL